MGSVLARRLLEDEVEIIRNHIDRRNAATDYIAVLFLRVIVLAERKADAMRQSAIALAFDGEPVADNADIRRSRVFQDLRFAGVHIDLNLGKVDGVHEFRVLLAFTGVGIQTGIRQTHLIDFAQVLRRDTVLDHFSVGAEGAVRLAHGVHQLARRVDGGFAGHDVLAAGCGYAGIGAGFCVVHDELYPIGCQSKGQQGLEGMRQRADIAALADILPRVKSGDGVVRVQFQRDFGCVMHADRGEEAAQAEPNADVTAFFFRGLGFGFVLVVHGLQLFHQRRVNGIAHIRSAVDGGVTRFGKVFVAELPGVDPSFFGGHIDERFAHRVDLRRPEAAVGRLEPVVGHAGAGQCLDIGDAVAVEGDGDEVTEDDAGDNGISAMVKSNVIFGGDDLTVFAAGQTPIGEGGAPLAGCMTELLIAERQGAGHP